MMFDYGTLVYDHKQKFLGKIQSTHPYEAEWNPNATHVLVAFAAGNRPEKHTEQHLYKCAVKNLQVIKHGTIIQVNPHRERPGGGIALAKVKSISDGYLYTYNGTDETDRIYFQDVGAPQPEGTEIEKFHRGQLVHLAYENNYLGTVAEVIPTPDGERYKVFYFSKNYLKKYQASGIASDSDSNVVWAAWRFSAAEGVAPRMKMSDAQRQLHQLSFRLNVHGNDSVKQDRLAGLGYDAAKRVYRSGLNKHFGSIIAKALAAADANDFDYISENAEDIVTAFGEIKSNQTRRTLWTRNGFNHKVNDMDILRWCSNCDNVEVHEEMNYSGDQDTSFCRRCAHNFIWSEVMEDYISSGSAIPLYTDYDDWEQGSAQDYVTRNWVERQDDHYMVNGVAMDADTFDYYRERNDDDGDGDGGNEETGGKLNQYHGAVRVWREQWSDKSYIPLGLEIEVFAEDRYTVVKKLREAFPRKMYLERDGSLSNDYGFEIVSQPFGKTEWSELAPSILNLLKKNGAIAYNEPAGRNYGIHVNLNRKYLTPLQETRMFMFLAAAENREFVTAIAQRSRVYNAQLSMGGTEKSNQRISSMGGLRTVSARYNTFGARIEKKTLVGYGKYAPIRLHERRLEIRIFQSTLNLSSFFKNIEFVWAMVEWTSIKSATGTSWMHTDFVQWLGHRPHAEKDFPHLMAFLRKPEFVRIDDSRVQNTWLEYLPKATRRSIPATVLADTVTEDVEDMHIPVIIPAGRIVYPATADVSFAIAA